MLAIIGLTTVRGYQENYYNNAMAPGTTYQGILVNVYLGGGWLLTGLTFNSANYQRNRVHVIYFL